MTETKTERPATDVLNALYWDYRRQRGVAPKEMHAGAALFDAFEGESVPNVRFIDKPVSVPQERRLVYRSAKVYRRGEGWQVSAPEPT